jgi:hypothetical protein
MTGNEGFEYYYRNQTFSDIIRRSPFEFACRDANLLLIDAQLILKKPFISDCDLPGGHLEARSRVTCAAAAASRSGHSHGHGDVEEPAGGPGTRLSPGPAAVGRHHG